MTDTSRPFGPERALGVLLICEDGVKTSAIERVLASGDDVRLRPIQLACVDSFWMGIERLTGNSVDVILADLTTGSDIGLNIVCALRSIAPDTPIVLIAEPGNAVRAVEALEEGAFDVLPARELTPLLLRRSLHYAAEHQQLRNQITHVASRDTLTGTPNRISFMQHVEMALARTRKDAHYEFALLFLDLDRLQKVNDSLGHDHGDELLVEFCRRIERCIRDGDVVARFGSDEFTVLVDGIARGEEAVEIANRIRVELQTPIAVADHDVVATASIGVCLSEIGYTDASEMLRDADTAMHRAKKQEGSEPVIFDQTMRDNAVARLTLEKDLRHAVENNNFQLAFQPIIRLDRQRIAAFEALLRWRHAERGFVSPADFIPVAEETGLVISIGRWVLLQACLQLQRWNDRFPGDFPICMAVNLSSKELLQPDLLDYIDRVLDVSGVDATCLDLEITETAIIENDEVASAMFAGFMKRGIRLSVDDFGMGYSSLSYLHRFNFDTLKIDRSFVDRLGDLREDSDAFVRTIVALSKQLGMDVVAEGIETPGQLRRLTELECDFGQGYFFSKPVNVDAAERLLAAQSTSDGRNLALFTGSSMGQINPRQRQVQQTLPFADVFS